MKIIKRRFESLQQPISVEHLKMFIIEEVKSFYNVLLTTNNMYNNYEFSNNSCMQFINNISTSVELKTFCLNTQKPANIIKFDFEVLQVKKNNITFFLEHNLKLSFLQLIRFGNKSIALLTNNSILIYEITSSTIKFLQKLPTPKPVKMAFGLFKDKQFLAILSNGQTKTLDHGFVEIYR